MMLAAVMQLLSHAGGQQGGIPTAPVRDVPLLPGSLTTYNGSIVN